MGRHATVNEQRRKAVRKWGTVRTHCKGAGKKVTIRKWSVSSPIVYVPPNPACTWKKRRYTQLITMLDNTMHAGVMLNEAMQSTMAAPTTSAGTNVDCSTPTLASGIICLKATVRLATRPREQGTASKLGQKREVGSGSEGA